MSGKVLMRFYGHDIEGDATTLARINNELTSRTALLAACKAQHEAIDRLMAQLIVLTREHTPAEPFMPTKSGQIWEACQAGHAAIQAAEARP